jgi:hypothetical protein
VEEQIEDSARVLGVCESRRVTRYRHIDGWRYPDGMRLAGYDYFGNGLADDIPYHWVTDFAARRSLLAMPYYPHLDDQFFLMFPAPGKGSGLERPAPLRTNWIGELDAARAFSRCLPITIPPHLVAWGGRLGLLEDVLARATTEPRAWNATSSGCARWFTAAYPAATSLRLESSIWTDHPGSLS